MKTRVLLSAFLLCISMVSQGQWTYDSLSQPRNWMGAATFGNKIYFAGGETDLGVTSQVEIFDVAAGTWETPANLSSARSTLSAVACDSLVFFAGGYTGNQAVSTIDVFDTRTQQWSVQQLSIPRFAISALSKDHKVLFAGGVIYNLTGYDRVDIYDTQTGLWSQANLSLARGSMASAVVGDVAIFAGGINQSGVTDRVDIYNFNTNTWSTAALSLARHQAEAVTLGNKVLIAGGMTGIFGVRSDRIDIYDTETNSWSTASLSYARTSACAAALNGRAYFIGGGKFGNNAVLSDFSDVIDIYDSFTDTWSVDNLAEPVMTHSVVCAGNKIFVAGGKTTGNQRVNTIEIFAGPSLIHVPAEYPTIQQGIAAASSGDTVLVAEGLYYENINFLGKKPLLVASQFIMDGDTNHISNTIINGSQPANPDIGSVVTFESGEDTTSVLYGFTITGGTGTVEASVSMRMGGGVHIKYSGGKLLNNYIHDNTVSFSGGVYGGGMQLGAPISEIPWIVLRGNRIYNNEAKSTAGRASGGGFFCAYNLIMENNEISHNQANGYLGGDGGGVAIGGEFGLTEVNVHNNEITNNEALTSLGTPAYAALGGGMGIYFNVTGSISNNAISYNSIDAPGNYWSWGPGVFLQDITSGGFVFENNLVRENSAITTKNCRGGGLSLFKMGGKYQNNVIQNNSASHGGAISITDAIQVSDTAIIINNTITENEATFGGGIYQQSSNSVVINSIIWGNAAPTGVSIHTEGSTLEVRYSDVAGDVVWTGEGNVNCSPTFLTDGYHLNPSCQLMEAGQKSVLINSIWYNCPGFDIDGDPRPLNDYPEIGADETLMVSIREPIASESFGLYPNPAEHFVTISVKNGIVIKEVCIYNQPGQYVYKGIPVDNTLDISKLKPGMYIIELVTDQGNMREKLVVE